MTRRRAQCLGAALELLYETALDPQRWPVALETLRRLLDLPDDPAAIKADEATLTEALSPVVMRIAAMARAGHRPAGDSLAAADQPPGDSGGAVIIVDESLYLLFANHAARELLASDAWLHIADDRLAGYSAAALRTLVGSLIGAAEFAEGRHPLATLPRGERAPLRIRALPLQPQATPSGAPDRGRRRVAMIMLADPTQEAARDRERLRRLFGLTAAEAEFALEIARGEGRAAAAARRGIAASTARTHLSNIFEKTGTRRQAELVRLLLQIGITPLRD